MKFFLILLVSTIYSCIALPRTNRDVSEKLNDNIRNIAGRASQIVATNLLKDNIDDQQNHVFSPLGISSVLAILGEGARGETYKEFITTFGYPEKKIELRESFNKILKNFDQKDLSTPSFKTWFYIYRNNTAKDEYKKILRDSYCVDVKDIDRMEYEVSKPRTSESLSSETSTLSTTTTSETSPHNSKDVIDFEDLKKSETFDQTRLETENKKEEILDEKKETIPEKLKEDIVEQKKDVKENEDKQEIVEINIPEKIIPAEEIIMVMVQDEENINDASKFDKVVDDKQYVEVPVIKGEISKELEKEKEILNDKISQGEKLEESKPQQENVEENETIKDSEKIEELKKEIESPPSPVKIQISDEPEKISIPLKKLEDFEILQALESHFQRRRFSGARTLFSKDDIASALSANAFVSKSEPSQTKMLLFNGLYYRGNWAYPFQQLRSVLNLEDDFHVNENKTIPAILMRSQGQFKFAEIEKFNSQAIELPYENNRYSLLLVVPNEINGLHSLIENLQPDDIESIKSKLQTLNIEMLLPKFQTEMTSHSEGTLKKLGLKTIFKPDLADLGDITEDEQLYVDEIVQHVNLRVDEGASSENFLTASSSARSSVEIDRTVRIDRPFIFFIMDNIENFVIIAGKTCAPDHREGILSELSVTV